MLNATYEPLKVISWQRAVLLFFQGKAEIVENYDRTIRSPSAAMNVPAVIRLRRFVKVSHTRTKVKFSRKTLFRRDRHQCQYCGTEMSPVDLTLDHIVPVCQGGATTWENLVTACKPCNYKKGGRTPHQANMGLLKSGRVPYWSPVTTVLLSLTEPTPKSWKTYLYGA